MKKDKVMPNSLAMLSAGERLNLIKERLRKEIELYIDKSSLSTKLKNHSDNSLAKEVGVTHTVITKWSKGEFKSPPHRENIIKLANVLKINPLYN